VRHDEVGRRRRVLGVCAGVLAHSHVCMRAQIKQIGQGSTPPGACVLVRGGLVRKIEIWPGGGVHGPVCASDESRREQCSRWRGTARRHQRPSSSRVCVTKSPSPEKA
jgi:hypothetical protein